MAQIPYDQTSPFGSKVYLAVQELRDAQYKILRCIDAANDITAGGTQPSNLETTAVPGGKQFGVATGQGANFYNALQSIKSAIISGGIALQATIDLDQG